MVAKIAIILFFDTLNLLSVSCASTSLKVFAVGRSLSPETRWFFNSPFITG